MIIPWVRIVWISDKKGYGLFATQTIPKGTITFAQDGLDIVLKNEDLINFDNQLQEHIEKYSYEDFLGNRVISWDLGKYMNHDDQANTLSTGYGFEIAIRDIEAGEEVTDDYRIFSTHHDTNSWHMGPKSSDLKPWPDELLSEWNQKVQSSLQLATKIDQPILSFIDKNIWSSVLLLQTNPSSYKCVSESFPLRYQLQMVNPASD